MPAEKRPARPYRAPLWLGLGSIVGLLVALIGGGLWNALAWVLLALPAIAVTYAIIAAMRGRRTSPASPDLGSLKQRDEQGR